MCIRDSVRTSAVDDLANLQFSITWNPSILQYVRRQNESTKITGGFFDFEAFTAEGILNFAWADLSLGGQDFVADELLFELCFDPVSNGDGDLRFTNASVETPLVVSQVDATAPSGQRDISGDFSFTSIGIIVENCEDTGMDGFTIAEATVQCGLDGQTCVGVRTSAVDDLANIQFSITWDETVLQYVRRQNVSPIVTGGFFDFEEFVSEGILNFAWADLSLSGQDFEDDELLFELCFNPISNGDGDLRFTNASVETPLVVSQVDEASPSGQRDISDGLSFSSGGFSVVDTIIPTVSNCPTDPIVAYTTFDNCQVVGAWTEPTFTDACGAVSLQQTNFVGDTFGVGDQVVQYTGVDASGNIATCSFVVSVRDTIAPTVVNCPNSIRQDVSVATNCDASVSWTPPTATDACSVTPIITTNFQPGDVFSFGTTTVRYTILDSSGNINNDCAFVVEITGEAPVRLTNCPENTANVITPDTGCDLQVTWTPPVLVDGCSVGNATLTSNFNPGDNLPLGVTTVTYMATDEGGNQDSCSFQVSITGSSAIVFPNCPGNIRVNSLVNQCGATVGWPIPETMGGCGNVNLVTNFSPNDFFPVGLTEINYTATDETSDQETCTFTVEVIDDVPMVVRCPTDVVVNANGGIIQDEANFISTSSFVSCGSTRLEYVDVDAFDNCSSTISRRLETGLASNSEFTGTTDMSIVVSNDSGEEVTCNFRIIVEEAPVFEVSLSTPLVCSGSPLTLQATNLPDANYAWSGPNGFVSNVQNPIINDPNILNTGDYTVIAMVPGGCTVSEIITVNVNQGAELIAEAEDIQCGGGPLELMASGMNIDTFSWTGPNLYTATEQNPIINNATALQTGMYIVTGIAPNGCTNQDTVIVEIATIDPPTVQASGILDVEENIACQDLPFSLKGNIFPEGAIYNWTVSNTGGGLPEDVGDSLIMVRPTNIGEFTYTYRVDLGDGCVADTSITINVLPSPQIETSSNAPILCATDTATLMLMVATDDIVNNWSWEGPNGFSSPFQNALIREVNTGIAGDYIITASSDNGCFSTDTLDIEITDQPSIPSFDTDRMMVCEGNPIILMPGVIDTGITYIWSGPDNFTASDSIIEISNALPSNSGGYQLIQSVDGCDSDPSSIIVTVLTDPEVNEDQIMNLFNNDAEFEVISNDTLAAGAGFTISILNDVDTEAGTIQNNGDGSFNFSPVQDWIGKVQFAYEICYEACPELCSMGIVTVDTDVSSEECIIPGVLSPNGDDRNDALIISCNSDPPKGGGIMIFNQWGAKVYESFPYNNDWIGTYQGEDLPDGVYYYIFTETDDADPVKGCVTIFR